MTKQTSAKPAPFPKKFFWGAAMAAHQVEGNNHNQWSVWELENAASLAERAKYELADLPSFAEIKAEATRPANYVSHTASDHYNRYEEDFDIAESLNMNALRFSIEWSRIEPREGEWDEAALEHYRLYLHALKRRNIEPFVTLWHWTVPEWFANKGGFEKYSNLRYFRRFAQKVLGELGADFRYVIILNEPMIYTGFGYADQIWPPGKGSKWAALRVGINLMCAHKQVARSARGINRKFKIGIAENFAYAQAGDDALLTRVSAWGMRFANDFFVRRIRRHLDFVGLNYYFTNRFYGNRVHNEDRQRNDLGWDMQPANIEHVLLHLHHKFKKPIIITENGLADRGDKWRQWWLTETIVAMQRALAKGVKLEGYLHWSLIDNFEWAQGFWPRFGLVHIDYRTKQRTIRPSAIWFGKVIKKLRHN